MPAYFVASYVLLENNLHFSFYHVLFNLVSKAQKHFQRIDKNNYR